MVTDYKPVNWKDIIDLTDAQEKDAAQSPPPPPPPPPPLPDWLASLGDGVGETDIGIPVAPPVPGFKDSWGDLAKMGMTPQNQTAIAPIGKGLVTKPPKIKTPLGNQVSYPMTDSELADMTTAEKLRYQSNPQLWLQERPEWVKNRIMEGTIKDIVSSLGFPTQADTTAEQIQLFVNTALWMLPLPIGKGAGFVYRATKGVLPDTAKASLTASEQLVKRIANLDIGAVTKRSGGKITEDVAKQIKSKAQEALSAKKEIPISPEVKASGATPPPKPPTDIPIGKSLPSPEDEVLNAFGKRIASPKTTQEFSAQKELWAAERTKRANRFSEILAQEQAKGVPAEEAIKNATTAFAGEFPRVSTGLDLPVEFKDAAYAKIIKVIQSDASIPEANKVFEIASTKTALDNALLGKPIPSIPGIKGGSAKTRLLRVFQDNPIVKQIIEHPEDVQKRLLENALPPQELDKDVLAYLRELPSDSSQLGLIAPSTRESIVKKLHSLGVNIIDALGIPKALNFGYDISMPFRQGALLGARHPAAWAKGWKPMLQALKSEEVTLKLNQEMVTDPTALEMLAKMKIDLYGWEKNLTWMQRPESMASKIAEKYIPGVRQSNRAAATFMNKLMIDVGKTTYKNLRVIGASEADYKSMGQLINWAAGRGTLPKWAQGTLGDLLNKVLSSPRFAISRFQFPTKIASASAPVRAEAIQTLVAFTSIASTVTGLAVASGAKFKIDRSSDSMKIVIGNKRFDLWLGGAQIQRLMFSLAPYVDKQGNIDWSMGSRQTLEGDVIPTPRSEILARYLSSKESPGIGALNTLLSGAYYSGEKLDLNTPGGVVRFFAETFTPSALREMVDAYTLEGVGSSAASGLGLAGISVNTYSNKTPVGKVKVIRSGENGGVKPTSRGVKGKIKVIR